MSEKTKRRLALPPLLLLAALALMALLQLLLPLPQLVPSLWRTLGAVPAAAGVGLCCGPERFSPALAQPSIPWPAHHFCCTPGRTALAAIQSI